MHINLTQKLVSTYDDSLLPTRCTKPHSSLRSTIYCGIHIKRTACNGLFTTNRCLVHILYLFPCHIHNQMDFLHTCTCRKPFLAPLRHSLIHMYINENDT